MLLSRGVVMQGPGINAAARSSKEEEEEKK